MGDWSITCGEIGDDETTANRFRSGNYDLDIDWTLIPQKSVARVQVREPRLNLTIEGPDEVVFGESQTYKVRVLNPGNGTASNVVFTLSLNSATPQSQKIGDIPPGKEAQFDIELTAKDHGDLKIHGLAAGDLSLRADAEKTIKVSWPRSLRRFSRDHRSNIKIPRGAWRACRFKITATPPVIRLSPV